MTETTNIFAFRQPFTVDDPLTDILRAGARELLARAVEIEVDTFLASTSELTLPDGRARLVRHGYGPARQIQTGIGPVEVARPKVRDRSGCGANRIPSARRSCRCGRGGPRAWMPCCRCSTCAASRPATSRTRCRRCLAKTRRTCHRR